MKDDEFKMLGSYASGLWILNNSISVRIPITFSIRGTIIAIKHALIEWVLVAFLHSGKWKTSPTSCILVIFVASG